MMVPTQDQIVRPFETPSEYERMIDYFRDGSDQLLENMGVERERLPSREAWLEGVLRDHERPDTDKERVYLAWSLGSEVVGHSSASHLKVGDHCHIHLHLWRQDLRQSGLGTEFFRRSIAVYFERLDLERVICEPAASNLGPNRTLARLGFRHLKDYRCVPTDLACEQVVSRWELWRRDFAVA